MQRKVPGDPGAGTSAYWVMPSNTATKISTIFRDRVITELIYLLISAAMVSKMFRRLIWIHIFYHFLAIRLYHEFLSQLNCHFDIAFFEHNLLQTTTAAKQANEILPTHTETPRNTTRKIANLYLEFYYHFLTLQKISLLLNRSVYAWYICFLGHMNHNLKYKEILQHRQYILFVGYILIYTAFVDDKIMENITNHYFLIVTR